ncbi:MAG TPA: TatD family hydrolase, partial [Propionibacteriaceae bacterium]|nr:TatD family hydrolase [Propionibacteriaceae bacterium]
MELPGLPDPLPAPVVDSHCHLDSTQAKSGLEPEEALRMAAEVGVTRIVQIGCDPEGCRWAVQAAERWPAVIAGVAIHPNDAPRMGPDLVSGLELVEALAQHPRVRAVGETGLDYYRTTDAAGQAVQRDAFAAHIAFAKTSDKTLVV